MKSLIVTALILIACQGKLEAYVECQPNAAGIQCTLTHREGSHAAQVCWTYVATCRNGKELRAAQCDRVSPMSKSSHLIQLGEIRGLSECDVSVASRIDNVQVSAAD